MYSLFNSGISKPSDDMINLFVGGNVLKSNSYFFSLSCSILSVDGAIDFSIAVQVSY
ncbi:MAG: hypothetical protein WCG25_05490 [bacterium]